MRPGIGIKVGVEVGIKVESEGVTPTIRASYILEERVDHCVVVIHEAVPRQGSPSKTLVTCTVLKPGS